MSSSPRRDPSPPDPRRARDLACRFDKRNGPCRFLFPADHADLRRWPPGRAALSEGPLLILVVIQVVILVGRGIWRAVLTRIKPRIKTGISSGISSGTHTLFWCCCLCSNHLLDKLLQTVGHTLFLGVAVCALSVWWIVCYSRSCLHVFGCFEKILTSLICEGMTRTGYPRLARQSARTHAITPSPPPRIGEVCPRMPEMSIAPD